MAATIPSTHQYPKRLNDSMCQKKSCLTNGANSAGWTRAGQVRVGPFLKKNHHHNNNDEVMCIECQLLSKCSVTVNPSHSHCGVTITGPDFYNSSAQEAFVGKTGRVKPRLEQRGSFIK